MVHRSAPTWHLRDRPRPKRTPNRPTTALRALYAVLMGAVYVLWASEEIKKVVCRCVGWDVDGVRGVGGWYRVRSTRTLRV